jgi:dTMP kinase
MNPLFITLEGTEGVGKTSNLVYIRQLLDAAKINYLVTREPGGTQLGEALRSMLLSNDYKGMCSDTELLLMFAARAEHVAQVVKPALAKGQWVLCDRFTDATFAYQGGGRQLDMKRIAELEQWVLGDLRPDLTLLLDCPLEIARARADQRSTPDRFEQEHDAFFNRVREVYLARAKTEPERIKVIDASMTLIKVQSQIEKVLKAVTHP